MRVNVNLTVHISEAHLAEAFGENIKVQPRADIRAHIKSYVRACIPEVLADEFDLPYERIEVKQ